MPKFWRLNPFPAKRAQPPELEPAAPAAPAVEDDLQQLVLEFDETPVRIDRDMVELAGAIVRNPAFDRVCRQIRKAEWDAWAVTAPDQKDIREASYLRLRALDDIVMKLGDMANIDPSTGKPRRLTKPKART